MTADELIDTCTCTSPSGTQEATRSNLRGLNNPPKILHDTLIRVTLKEHNHVSVSRGNMALPHPLVLFPYPLI